MNPDKTMLYLAYIDIYEFYSLLDKHKIQSGNWRIEKKEIIVEDFTVVSKPGELFDSYVFHTQYISYKSLITILNEIFANSSKHSLKENIIRLFSVVHSLSSIFENIYNHVDFSSTQCI